MDIYIGIWNFSDYRGGQRSRYYESTDPQECIKWAFNIEKEEGIDPSYTIDFQIYKNSDLYLIKKDKPYFTYPDDAFIYKNNVYKSLPIRKEVKWLVTSSDGCVREMVNTKDEALDIIEGDELEEYSLYKATLVKSRKVLINDYYEELS